MHALIVGARGVGKSSLIQKVTDTLGLSVCGFKTKKDTTGHDPILGDPVYFYPLGEFEKQPRRRLVGYNGRYDMAELAKAFDCLAPMVESARGGDIVLMDEIGFMESASKRYCRAIMSHLYGDVPVIAAVKINDTPFLNSVRSHPNCRCFYITEDNRGELFHEVLEFVKTQMNLK